MTDTRTATIVELWTYPDGDSLANIDFSGFAVEARDGEIGSVDEATYEAGGSYVVVDTGPWIFGKRVMLPAGVVERIDVEGERIWVSLTKDEIKSAPEFDESTYRDATYRDDLATYYDQRRRGYRDW